MISVEVINEVVSELERQHVQWGDQHHSEEHWLTILTEEVGEVAGALLRKQENRPIKHSPRQELVQVAAIALNALYRSFQEEE